MNSTTEQRPTRIMDQDITVVIPTVGRAILEQSLTAIIDGDRVPGRIVAQQGVFTVHGGDTSGLDEQFSGKPCRIARILLDSERRYSFWWDLIRAGVNRTSVFPELDSVTNVLIRSEDP